MALKTLTEQLEDVQTVIAKAEAAQSVSDGRQSRTMANLDVLYKREKDLKSQIALTSQPSRRLAEF